MILLLFVAVIAAIYIPSIYAFAKELSHKKRLAALIPGQPGWPILGDMDKIGHTSETMPIDIQKIADKMISEGRNLAKLWFSHHLFLIPLNGEALKDILDSNETITKGDDYDLIIPWLGYGLLTSTGSKWKSRRRLLTPTFHFSMLDGYIYTMNKHARILSDDILAENNGQEVDMFMLLKRCTFDIICETAMGKELDSQHNHDQDYVRAISDFMRITAIFSLNALYWNPVGRWISGYEQQYWDCIKRAHHFTNTVIAERSEALRRGEVESTRRALLDMLLEQKQKAKLNDEDIREEVDTFMFEGHDTTTCGLSWTVWCFACHPEYQQKAHDEIVSVLGSSSEDITKESLPKLVYLERCIKESMRIFPPVPMVTRLLHNDFQLGEHLLPKGANITIAPLIVHHNENIYPDSWRYDPDRFLPDNVQARHAYDYIPFSAGPRNCIGQKFALYEEKIIMARLLQRYRFETDKPFLSNKRLVEAVLRPSLGIPVILHRR